MRLETHETVIADADDRDVERAVASLTDPREAYVILGDDADQETYLQAACALGDGFVVERRDGCAGEHYRGDRQIRGDELLAMLAGYLRGDASWSHSLSWHRVPIDGERGGVGSGSTDD